MRSLRGLLFPQEGIFFDLLEKESKNVLAAAKLLASLTEKFDSRLPAVREEIKDLELKGDKIVYDINELLNQSFITPIDHEDIAALAVAYDEVLDYTYSVVNRMFIYNIKKVDQTMVSLARLVLGSTKEIDKAFGSMRRLSQKGIDECYHKIHEFESEADGILDQATASLFKKKDFIEILKLKELYEILESTTDRCEDVGDILRNIVLKHT